MYNFRHVVAGLLIALGIGLFGLEFNDGYQFASTVTTTHIAFGTILAVILIRLNGSLYGLGTCKYAHL